MPNLCAAVYGLTVVLRADYQQSPVQAPQPSAGEHDAKFDQHIDAVVAKANRTLGFLRCNLGIGKSNIKAQLAYKSLVRPLLEYLCTEAAQKDIDRLEAVQRRATTFAPSRHQRTVSIKLMLP